MFAADSRTSSIFPANLSVAAMVVAAFAILIDADRYADGAVFVSARVALCCFER